MMKRARCLNNDSELSMKEEQLKAIGRDIVEDGSLFFLPSSIQLLSGLSLKEMRMAYMAVLVYKRDTL